MKEIVLRKLTARDFKVYKSFEFNFERPGCHAITGKNLVTPRLGSNGVGKSTLWDAVTYCLFGFTAKKLRGADVQPYGSDASPCVSLDLLIDGTPLSVTRWAVPHKLYIDTEPAKQERLDALIYPLSIDLFLQTVLFAQSQPLFVDLEPRHKLDLLSGVLNLDRFEHYSDKAKQQHNALSAEDTSAALAHNTATGGIAEVGRLMATVRTRSEAWDAGKRERMAKLQADYRAAEAEMHEAARVLDKWRSELERAQADHDRVWPLLAVADSDWRRLLALYRQLDRGKACPTCGQDLPDNSGALNDVAAKLAPAEAEHARLGEDMRGISARLDTARPAHFNAEARIRNCERAHASISAAIDAEQRQGNPHRDEMHKLKDRLSELHRAEREIAHQRQAIALRLQNIEPWVSGFKEIRLSVLDSLLTGLSVLTTSYAQALGLPVEVAYAVERTAKAGHAIAGIHMSVEGHGRWEAWSGGEAQRLRLAASLALSATLLAEGGLSIPLLALDEPSAALSPEGLEELVGFLSEHAVQERRSIYVTDQRRMNLPATMLVREADGVRIA